MADDIGPPIQNFIYVNEEGLLPGAEAPAVNHGQLQTSDLSTHQYAFLPIEQQDKILSRSLSAEGEAIDYELSADGQTIRGYQQQSGDVVFELTLTDEANYSVQLFKHLDRSSVDNLIDDPLLQNLQSEDSSWQSTPSQDNHHVLSQVIHTHPDTPYHLTFYYHNPLQSASNIEIYWNNELIHTLPPSMDNWTSFTFLLQGTGSDTALKIVANDGFLPIEQYIQNISLVSAELNQLPLEFAFMPSDAEAPTADYLAVNFTTEPPIKISEPKAHTIVFEQSVYKTIILESETFDDVHPLTTLNLDAVFETCLIPQEQRLVEVVQRQADGQATNVYEVQISDVYHEYEPITVADVQLAFPGGDGGLNVFQRSIAIEEI